MDKIKVFFAYLFYSAFDYFTEDAYKKTFFVSICVTLVSFVLASGFGVGFFAYPACIGGIVSLLLSAKFSKEKLDGFREGIHRVKLESLSDADDDPTYSQSELDFIKKRERAFKSTIMLKILFAILLVVLFVKMV